MAAFVSTAMSIHDSSHNPAHVHRVVTLARKILAAEQRNNNDSEQVYIPYDPYIINLAALLQDIGDQSTGTRPKPYGPIPLLHHNADPLLHHNADPLLAARVQTIVSHVSYTAERADPLKIHCLIHHDGCSELAIVQDADRLDALGAVDIGRCFTFLEAQVGKLVPGDGEWELGSAIEHFGEELEKLEGLMKTRSGGGDSEGEIAELREFRGWWEEEMGLVMASSDAIP